MAVDLGVGAGIAAGVEGGGWAGDPSGLFGGPSMGGEVGVMGGPLDYDPYVIPANTGWQMAPGWAYAGMPLGSFPSYTEQNPYWGDPYGFLKSRMGYAPPVIPRYFSEQPAGMPKLSPAAMRHLAKLYPSHARPMEAELGEYVQTPYEPGTEVQWDINTPGWAKTGDRIGQSIQALQGIEEKMLKPAVEGTKEVKGETAAMMPKRPSAQWWKKSKAEGLTPLLQAYVTDVLGIPWESFTAPMQAGWAPAQKRRTTGWKTPFQR